MGIPAETPIPQAPNFAKRMVASDWNGLTLMLEYKAGDVKKSDDGSTWYMSADYGYIVGTTSPEEEEMDYFMGPDPSSDKVTMISLLNPVDGSFVEYKIMLGYPTTQAALDAFANQYWGERCGPAMSMSIQDLKDWCQSQTLRARKDKMKREEEPQLFMPADIEPPYEEYVNPEPPLVLLDDGDD